MTSLVSVGDHFLIFRTPVLLTFVNVFGLCGILKLEGEIFSELDVGKDGLIRVILSMKNLAKESANDFGDVQSGRTVSGYLCRMILKVFHNFLGLSLILFIAPVYKRRFAEEMMLSQKFICFLNCDLVNRLWFLLP